MATEKREKQIVRIRKGLNGWQVSECREDGRFIQNAESIEQIKALYDYEIKHWMVKFIKELGGKIFTHEGITKNNFQQMFKNAVYLAIR